MDATHVNNKSDGLFLRQEIEKWTSAGRKNSGIEPGLGDSPGDGFMVSEHR